MATGTYVTKRNGSARWYARQLVPDDLRIQLGRDEIWVSTRTADEKKARREASLIFARHTVEFERLRRTRAVTESDLQQATYNHYIDELEADRRARAAMPKQTAYDAERTRIVEEIRTGTALHLGHHVDLAVLDPEGSSELYTKLRSLRRKSITKHLKIGETVNAHAIADDFITRHALAIEKGSPAYIELCQRLQRAELEALKRADERDNDEWGGSPTDPAVKAPSASQKALTAKPGESLTDRFEEFYRERAGAISADTWAQNRTAFGLFADFIGHSAHVTAVTRKAVSAWKQQLMLWPVQAANTKAFEGLGFKATIAKNITIGKPPICDKTINRYLSGVAPFFEWLLVNEHIEIDVMRGQYLILDKSVKKVRPYTLEQLQTIFASPIYSGALSDRKEHLPGDHQIRDWRYWLPILALYTGARLGELCQLNTADVRQIGQTWIIHVTVEGEGDKRTKTAGSMRVIPLHPKVVEAGFLSFHASCVAAKQTRLFPTLERDQRGQFGEPSRFFGRYLDRIGVSADRSQNFHSFRHGIADAFRRAGFRDEEFAPILGHVKATTTARYGLLSEGTLAALKQMIDAVEFGSLTIGRHPKFFKPVTPALTDTDNRVPLLRTILKPVAKIDTFPLSKGDCASP